MCGIAGFVSRNALTTSELEGIASGMAAALIHRGPDHGGTWSCRDAGLAFGFRRLAILDLSPAGDQPMRSACGRFTIVFNGEVYNYRDLRAELEGLGHGFRGHSDTEVILASFRQWGIEDSVQRFVGMFAMAVWDRDSRSLSLIRDRIGIKPLYYGWSGQAFLFGSELKALRAHPAFVAEIDRDALALQMQFQYVPGPYSIFSGIFKLKPGCIATLSPDKISPGVAPTVKEYWSVEQASNHARQAPFGGSEGEALEELDRLVLEAVRLRMISDVPLGAFLSGGIDSSLVVAAMQAQSSLPVRTFTIGFNQREVDESAFARRVAQHLGTAHTELILQPQDALDALPHMPEIYDEPFGDSSQIPTYMVSRLARDNVVVSLSGDGGDELFGGYTRYLRNQRYWNLMGRFPRAMRTFLAGCLNLSSSSSRSRRIAEYLGSKDRAAFYTRSVSFWSTPEELVPGAGAHRAGMQRANPEETLGFAQEMMNTDMGGYLPDDILVKVDRASMAVSLEARVPLLDHRLVEFSLRIPLSMKIREGRGKYLLRKLLHRYVPEQLVERPKAGFAIPLAQWLRGELRSWACDLLSPEQLHKDGFLDSARVTSIWKAHLAGKEDLSGLLWQVLTFQSWYGHQKKEQPVCVR
jgi:asparagine synthase (glutamine-hydrolysing)